MQIPSHEQLLEAGVHFGHQIRRWNPLMKRYIFMARQGIHIIDLKKTRSCLEEAVNLIAKVSSSGKRVLFVSTKKQGRECVKEHAQRCGQFYMTERWLGGTLTNHRTIFKSIHRLEELERQEEEGYIENLTKKEMLQRTRAKERLQKYLGGIRGMKELPGAMVVVDIKKEHIAINEARVLKIPCVAIVDTNCDPSKVNYPVPGNDDAIKSISLIVGTLADAVLLGREGTDLPEDEEILEEMVQVQEKPDKDIQLDKDIQPDKDIQKSVQGKKDKVKTSDKKTEKKDEAEKKTEEKSEKVKKEIETKTAKKTEKKETEKSTVIKKTEKKKTEKKTETKTRVKEKTEPEKKTKAKKETKKETETVNVEKKKENEE